ncbi:MAG: hypothetical protein KGV51_03185 [Moraxellaceae bacterium]|nr:hypothetical protein [Moraxellaceae bacterium]
MKAIKALTLAITASLALFAVNANSALPPQNPYLSANGGATMHGDASSSDTSPYAGAVKNSQQKLKSTRIAKQSACPTVLFGSDNMPITLCTQIFGRSPIIYLFDKDNNKTLASLQMTKGSLLGGVYAYMDNQNQLVMVDGNDDLVRVAHKKEQQARSFWDILFGVKKEEKWQLQVAEKTSIKDIVRNHCGGKAGCDSVVGLVPDWQGNVFVATKKGVVGVVNPYTKAKSYIKLPQGERIDNSISSAPEGVAITTSHATYLLKADAQGKPYIVWRKTYDRGTARKPGQLSWGTGATATFFGEKTGSEYLTITDNADKQINLLVYETKTGKEVCKQPIFNPYKGGTENSAIAYNNSIYVANTFGYPYPKYPEGAGESVPKKANFDGGMERIDIINGKCKTVWKNDTVKSSAVPRLSTVDGLIYTMERKGLMQPSQQFYSTIVDSQTGQVVRSDFVGFGFIFDTLEMVGTIMPNGTWYQGVLSGVVKTEQQN